ncbi:hypothetical protein AB0C47_34200 [Micromonospora taraxaci]|uniref:hypothetical protein n=1 Tax=Micromonospora taraxaci TaxID=1316803 RepID=UPI0033C7C078
MLRAAQARMAAVFTKAVRAELAAALLVDPQRYLAPARDAIARTVAQLVITIS